ncbi:MAG: hypothetical protein ACRD3M_12415 [Thermoanaerobaculia bacterium]
MRTLLAILLGAVLALPAPGASPPPTLRIPGSPDRPIAPESLLGSDRSDVRLEDAQGDVTVYHGRTLLEVLERNGVDTRTMPGQRKLAPAVVTATARDGYTVVFSAGELLMHRGDPRVFLVCETAAGPLPENEGPVRLIVYGDRARSSYGLARIELNFLAENTSARKP